MVDMKQQEPKWIFGYTDIIRIRKSLEDASKNQGHELQPDEATDILAKLTGQLAQLQLLYHMKEQSTRYGAISVATLTSYIQQLERILSVKYTR